MYQQKQIAMKKKFKNSKTLLVGEGVHQHTLYGNFEVEQEVETFAPIKVKQDSLLWHEKPDGSFSDEHKGLKVEKGNWVMGRQVEYNPFDQTITNIFD